MRQSLDQLLSREGPEHLGLSAALMPLAWPSTTPLAVPAVEGNTTIATSASSRFIGLEEPVVAVEAPVKSFATSDDVLGVAEGLDLLALVLEVVVEVDGPKVWRVDVSTNGSVGTHEVLDLAVVEDLTAPRHGW